MKTLLTLSLAWAAWAQNTLTPPQIGFMRDAAGGLRPVFGIAGNFLPRDAVVEGVISAASSGAFALAKTDSAMIALDREGQILASWNAAGGPALFAFSRTGAPALAYLPLLKTLYAWNEGTIRTVPLDDSIIGGTVVSMAAREAEHVAMVVQRDDVMWELSIRLETGELESQAALPGVTAPILLLPNGVLIYSDSNGIVIRQPDTSERHIGAQLPERFPLQQMAEDWIQLGQFAIRITPDREQVYQLPEVNQ